MFMIRLKPTTPRLRDGHRIHCTTVQRIIQAETENMEETLENFELYINQNNNKM